MFNEIFKIDNFKIFSSCTSIIFEIAESKLVKKKPKQKTKTGPDIIEAKKQPLPELSGQEKNKLSKKPIMKGKVIKKTVRLKPGQPRKLKKKPSKGLKKVPIKKVKFTTKPQKEKPSRGEELPIDLLWLREDPQELLLSRFVETPKGTRVGESIGVEKRRIILKNKLTFYSIPLNAIKEKDDKLILRRKVDWERAAKLGEIWRKKTLDVINVERTKKSKVIKVK